MKICLLSPTGIYPDKIYGPPIVAYNLAKELSKIATVKVIAGTDNEIKQESGSELDIVYFKKKWGWQTDDNYLSSVSTPLKLALQTPSTTIDLMSYISDFSPDVLLYNLIPIGPAFITPYATKKKGIILAARVPVWFPKELEVQSKNNISVNLGSGVYKKIARKFDVIITPSPETKQFFNDNVPEVRCEIIPNGVDCKRFQPSNEPSGSKIKILFVGKVSKQKGIMDLLRAISLLESQKKSLIEVNIVGKHMPEEKTEFDGFIKTNGLAEHVNFLGEIDYFDLPATYRNSDIFVLPSKSEGFPQVLVEAMASGLCVIGTNIAAIPTIIKDKENGILIEPGDADALHKHTSFLLENKEERDRLGQEARKTAETYNWKLIAKKYLELFESMKAT